MSARVFVVVWVVLSVFVVAWNARAHAAPRSGAHAYRAVVWCEGMAEDTAAHIHLVDYGHRPDGTPRIVYVCEHTGY